MISKELNSADSRFARTCSIGKRKRVLGESAGYRLRTASKRIFNLAKDERI